MLETLLERFRRRDRLALARLVSLVARGEQVEEILAGVGESQKPARVIAVTGSGGVGKSTLTGKLIEEIRRHGPSVAVLACDPQSPLSGGALLGDRFRMPARPDDEARKKISAVQDRLTAEYGYDEHSAKEALSYVTTLLAQE